MLLLAAIHASPSFIAELSMEPAQAVNEFGGPGCGSGLAAGGSPAALRATFCSCRSTAVAPEPWAANLIDFVLCFFVGECLCETACWDIDFVDAVGFLKELPLLVEVAVCSNCDLLR